MQHGESVPAVLHDAKIDRGLGGERSDRRAILPRQGAGAQQQERTLRRLERLGEIALTGGKLAERFRPRAEIIVGIGQVGALADQADGEFAGAPALAAPRAARGGLGNKALASARRVAPGFALLGEPGGSLEIVLDSAACRRRPHRLPSAGKSSLVSVVSAAKPKIADYPFTTLIPNLGVVTAGAARFTIADVPGLIPGAQRGQGARPGVPAPRRALLGARPRRRLRDAGSRTATR